MKDFRRLKQDENSRLSLDWNLNRALSKVNYRIHTDAVKENLIPPKLTPEQSAYTYASEADLLNVALFGQTAKQWKNNNPGSEGKVALPKRAVPRSIAEKFTSLLDVKFFSFAGFGYKMLAEAVKADLSYHISCPVLLICGERDKAGSAKSYNKK